MYISIEYRSSIIPIDQLLQSRYRNYSMLMTSMVSSTVKATSKS